MTRTLSVRITHKEWMDFHRVCDKHNVTVQDLLHGMIKDAIVDEDYVLQCRRQEGCSPSRETG